MALTNAKIGFGGLFKIQNDDSPQVYTSIGECTSIKPPGIARDAVEATHSESPDGYREYISGLKDGQEASADLNLVPGSVGTLLLLAQFENAALSVCQVTIPTSPAYVWSFNAVLTGFESDMPIDDRMTATVTFKISGKPTLAVAS